MNKIKRNITILLLFCTTIVMSNLAVAATQGVILKAGKLIQVNYMEFKNDAHSQSNLKYYLSKAFPITQEYGGRFIQKFDVVETTHGRIQAKEVSFFEWPSLQAFESFNKDSRYQAIIDFRNNALVSLKTTFTKVNKDTLIDFEDDELYELMNVWENPLEFHLLINYFKGTAVLAQRENTTFPANLIVTGTDPKYALKPDFIVFVKWDEGKASRDRTFNSPEFQVYGHLRARGIDRIYGVLLKPVKSPL